MSRFVKYAKRLAWLILVSVPYMRSEEDFIAVMRASCLDIEERLERARKLREAREKREMQWEDEKSSLPRPVRQAVSELGY